MSEVVDSSNQTQENGPKEVDVAIIGAGIAGLYCGFWLRKTSAKFCIAEASNHIGGRIWSTRFLQDDSRLEDDEPFRHNEHKLEFTAEFGPMRVEIDSQPLLRKLIHDLGLQNHIQPFPAYASPSGEHDPHYELEAEEASQETPLDLLRLAMVRIIGRLEFKKGATPVRPEAEPTPELFNKTIENVTDALARAAGTRQANWKEVFERWLGNLNEVHYQSIREHAVFDDGTSKGTPLYHMGFWNVISEVLSHHAVLKLRDLGAFYHLIPENPNAAEWFIFWLRALKTSSQLVGIKGGMQCITEALAKKIDQGQSESLIKTRLKLVGIAPNNDDRVRLTFERTAKSEELLPTPLTWIAKHVILAIPRGPLEELLNHGNNKTHLYQELSRDLGSTFGFPLLKMFVVIKERWWNHDEFHTNRYATRIPTRELHLESSKDVSRKKGFILVYTDRPATSFWSNYIPPAGDSSEPKASQITDVSMAGGTQDEPSWMELTDGEQEDCYRERVVQKCLKYLKEMKITKKNSDILAVGIRDWGRKPFLGACHAWYPERKSWEFLKRLAAFPLRSDALDHKEIDAHDSILHICGEAYSDYQGFIEGALRSAHHVLHTIEKTGRISLKQADEESSKPDSENLVNIFGATPTPWLCKHSHSCDHKTIYEPK